MDRQEINEQRIPVISQAIYNYCRQGKGGMTDMAFIKAKNSMGELLDNLSDRDRRESGIPESVKKSIDRSDGIIAKCSQKQADALAKIAVYQGVSNDLNLYPVTAEQKIGRDQMRGVISDYDLFELTLRDMMYFICEHVRGTNLSKKTMPAIYNYLKGKYDFDPYMSKVVAQVYFRDSHYLKISGWGNNGAGRKLLEAGRIRMGDDGMVSLVEIE